MICGASPTFKIRDGIMVLACPKSAPVLELPSEILSVRNQGRREILGSFASV